MKPSITGALLLVLLGFSLHSRAQIVNIEKARMQSDTTGWMGSLGTAFSLNKNTREIFGADVQLHLQYKTSNDRGLWLFLGNSGFLKAGNDRLVSDAMMHVRYNRKVNDWLRWEVFGQFQNNAITQIDSRALLGTGPRFKILSRPKFKLYAASLMMYEREKERTRPVVRHNDLRSSSYLSFTWLPRENIELISTTYFQPLVSKFSDNRILNQVVFRVKATPHFGMSMRWNYLHDRFPAGTAPRTVYSFATGLDYDL